MPTLRREGACGGYTDETQTVSRLRWNWGAQSRREPVPWSDWKITGVTTNGAPAPSTEYTRDVRRLHK